MKPRLLYVEWLDSRHGTSKWEFLAEMRVLDVCHCVSVGFLMMEDDRTLRLSNSLADLDYPDIIACGTFEIPKCSILKRKVLKW